MYRKQYHRQVLPQIDENKESLYSTDSFHFRSRSSRTKTKCLTWLCLMIGLTVHGVRKNKTATRLTTEKKFQATTAQNLLDSGKAIKAHIHSKNPSIPMVFDMLVFPLSIDKVISRDIVEKEMYEPEMSQFIHLALTTTNQAGQVFAVDIGANVGFHTLHMAYLGAQVIALEPAPDTGDLLRGSLELNPSFLVTLVRAAAAEAPGHGQLSRHPDSPGLTTLASTADLPKEWNLKQMDGEANHNQATDVSATSSTIPLVMAKDVLNRHGVPNLDTQQLVLLKVDAEGFELQALRGLDLSAFPFRFLALEFFPLLIQGSGVQDPIDLLVFLSDHGYHCSLGSFDATQLLKRDRRQWQEWVDQNGIMTSHVNLYCERKGDET